LQTPTKLNIKSEIIFVIGNCCRISPEQCT